MHFLGDPQKCVPGGAAFDAYLWGKRPEEVHEDPVIRRVLLGPSEKGVCFVLWTEGGLTEKTKHGPLTDLFFYLLSDVADVISGRCVFFTRRSRDGALITGRETIFKKCNDFLLCICVSQMIPLIKVEIRR